MPIDARDLHTLKGKSKGNIDRFGAIEGDSSPPVMAFTEYRNIGSKIQNWVLIP